MKKLLVLAAALLGFSAAQAQFAPEPVNQPTEQIGWLAPQQVKVQAVEAPALDAPSMESRADEQAGMLRAYVDPGTSVWYQKPKGTYSYTYTSSSLKYACVVAPMFMPLTFINKYATPEEATWMSGAATPAALNPDANFNYRTSYAKPTSNNTFWRAPIIIAETDTFRFGGTYVTDNSRSRVLGTVEPRTVYTVDKNQGYYTSFTGYTYFGRNTNNANPTTTVKQYMEAPAAPMWVEDIWFHYCSLGDTLGALQNGATVTFTIYSLAYENSMTGATVLYTTEITADNIMTQNAGVTNAGMPQTTGYIEIPVGMVIEGPYAIVLDGFNREGVNFGVYMAQLGNTADFYGRDGVHPTLVTRVDAETGAVLGDWYQYNATNGTQYNAVFALDMMWDVAYMNTNYLNMTAPAAGGDLQMVGSNGTTYKGIAVRTTYVWDEGGYTIDGLPEWLTVTTHTDADYYANNNSSTLVHFNAAPNYTGETRTATLRVVSAKGAKSQEVTVTQEAAEMPDVYILGEVNEQSWAPNAGTKMDYNGETCLYTDTIACDGRNSGYNYFSFTTVLAENNDDGGWAYIEPYRFGAVAEPNELNPDGNFIVTDEWIGKDLALTYDNGKAFQIPAGEYILTLNLDGLNLVIDKVASSKPGDANGDGNVDVNDVTTVINYILGKNPNPFVFDNANVNDDDDVNVNDVTMIINMILGII